MTTVVVGLAVTGIAVVEHERARGRRILVLEDRPDAPVTRARAKRVRALGGEVVASPDAAAIADAIARAELLVPSPGVPPAHPAVVGARAAGVPIRSEIDLAADALAGRARAPKLVAVTGTNGKTTVTTWTAQLLEAAGVRASTAGNIGRPLLDAVSDDVDVVVAEVSSFQLDLTTAAFAPDVAVLLNVAADHLDWHGSPEAYERAKAKVFQHQSADGALVAVVDDPVVRRLAASAPGHVIAVTGGEPSPGSYGVREGDLHGPSSSFGRADRPAYEVIDVLASVAAAVEAGAAATALTSAPESLRGLSHRSELVAEVAGVRFFDDSKATNPHATAGALAAFDQVVLIAGGRNKALDLGVLREHATRVRSVVAIGESASDVEAVFAGLVPVDRADSMAEAVRCAASRAVDGDVVLLSPACASLDWYDGYAERGDDFAAEVRKLTEVRT